MSGSQPGTKDQHGGHPVSGDAAETRFVREELQRILAAPSFRASKRCSEFLSFVVERTLDGKGDDLKERTLGVSLFGRTPTYDTPGDPVVRVKANEVRKRLAQYYDDHAGGSNIRIDLPPGSYVPVFRHPDAVPAREAVVPPAPARSGRFRRPVLLVGASIAVVAVALSLTVWPSRPDSPLDTFWSPVLRSDAAPILCVGSSGHVWLLSDRLSAELGGSLAQEAQPAKVEINAKEAVAAPSSYFSIGSVKSALALFSYLSARGSRAQLRVGAPLTMEDFRNHTILAVGAFSNPWTLQRLSEMRFRFDRGSTDGEFWLGISDTQNAKNHWRVRESPFGASAVDYALVTRMFDPGSKTVFVSLAGLNQFGTEAAAEFITNPRYWKDLVQHAPAGWASKNLQVVIETAVVESRPTLPRVMEVYFW
jgi:hypothetical protein